MTEKARMETQLQHFFQTTLGHHLYVMGESYYDEINDFPCSLYVYNTQADTWEHPTFEVFCFFFVCVFIFYLKICIVYFRFIIF